MEKLVGIQTPHYAYNYGAQIQAFALKEAVKSLGYNVVFINKRPLHQYLFENKKLKLKRFLENKREGKYFIEFERKYLQPQTELILFYSDFGKIDFNRFYAVIVGSDQVWRPEYWQADFPDTWRPDYKFFAYGYANFFGYINDIKIKKISYAASFGKGECIITNEAKENIKKLLGDFHAISVREKSGVNVLKKTFNVNSINVIDPTLLFDNKFYTSEFNLKDKVGDYITAYILDKGQIDLIKLIGKRERTNIQYIYNPLFYKSPFSHFRYLSRCASVPEWIEKIKNAQYVITDSFHGMLFSIIFRKQFIVIDNKNGGSDRFISILNALSLRDRLIDKVADIDLSISILKKTIDYKRVAKLIEEQRAVAYTFLKESLSN